jgi:L,D-peptidoglycan transpeptidase YkuD (ErfK/YbiS/YcfS/YnhG family)
MRSFLQALLLLTLTPNAFAGAPRPPRTMITVVTEDETFNTGELRRWERAGKSWRQIGDVIPIVIGSKGFWPAERKVEGDGYSPSGRFALGDVTGYDDNPPRGLKLRYRKADGLVCYDDPDDRRTYNLVRGRTAMDDVPEPHFENMRRDDELYRYTIFVRHNEARVPGRGSCIFLHVWRDAHSPTVGCTAMALDDLRAILRWVEPSTILVQLAREEYERRQRDWDLPPLPPPQRK